jgi:hypothetical protein
VLLRPLPPLIGRLVDGEIRQIIDVQGGLRLIYSVTRDPPACADVLGERARRRAGAAEARVEEGQVVVDVPGVPEADRERFVDLLGGTNRLAFKIVLDGSSYMKALADRVHSDRASLTGISVDTDDWMHEATGERHSDFFIYGTGEALERYLATLPPPEPGTELAFERFGRGPPTPRWRTYYLPAAPSSTSRTSPTRK